MPTLTITVWNIQDYGLHSYRFRRGYTALHNFIAWVVLRQQTDILFMLEMQQLGTARLPNLRAALAARVPGANWYYDWIKGAIIAGVPAGPNTNITTAAQLDWTLNANREGYAVFFRDNLAKFSMTLAAPTAAVGVPNTQSNGVQPAPVPGHIPTRVLSLALTGRPPAPNFASPWAYVAPNFNPAAPPAWNNLDFPRPIGAALHKTTSRRPAMCVIQLNAPGGVAATLMPLLAYHAPSNGWTANAPPAGTQAANFTRQLYQARDPTAGAGWAWINNNRALACGDFNVDGNPAILPHGRHLAYTSYLSPFAASGAGMTASAVPLGAVVPGNNTALSLNVFIGGPPIASVVPVAYRTAEFDNIFTRGVPAGNIQIPPRGVIYDLITAVRPAGSLTGAPVTNFVPLVTAAIAGSVMAGGRPVNPATGNPIYPQITNWANFWAGVNAGHFPTVRSAAEFVKLFVSDHLPVTFRFTY